MNTESFEIIVPAEGTVVKEVKLTPAMPAISEPPPQSAPPPNLESLLYPVRDEFETVEEFQQRRENLLKQFNDAVQRHEIGFQAGVATLDKKGYNIETGMFPMRIEWAEWAKKFDLSDSSIVLVSRDDAKELWTEGAQKPVFLLMRLEKDTVTPRRQFIMAKQREWTTAKYAKLSLKAAESINSIEFSGDSATLVARDVQDSIWAWNLNSAQPVHDLPIWSARQPLHFHPQKPLITRVFGSTIYLDNSITLQREQTFTTEPLVVFDTAFSPDGKILAAANALRITLWDIESGITINTFEGFEDAFLRISYSSDGKTLAALNNSGKIQIIDATTGKILNTVERDKLTKEQLLEGARGYYPSLLDNFVANARHSASISAGKSFVILTDATTHEAYVLAGQSAEISVIALSSDGQWLAAGRVDGTIDLWKLL
jgi:WD40 repeat protein